MFLHYAFISVDDSPGWVLVYDDRHLGTCLLFRAKCDKVSLLLGNHMDAK